MQTFSEVQRLYSTAQIRDRLLSQGSAALNTVCGSCVFVVNLPVVAARREWHQQCLPNCACRLARLTCHSEDQAPSADVMSEALAEMPRSGSSVCYSNCTEFTTGCLQRHWAKVLKIYAFPINAIWQTCMHPPTVERAQHKAGISARHECGHCSTHLLLHDCKPCYVAESGPAR